MGQPYQSVLTSTEKKTNKLCFTAYNVHHIKSFNGSTRPTRPSPFQPILKNYPLKICSHL
ncbi:hypothetical protein HanLR1_Chr03g0082721 [Helianthus annuus]|nr:hypothetical protein HanHA89_Chr03g0089511 [Helianthus annuus]KAJ0766884.1 hypothetical protein HanLR1_Chr03g0082721 [Helianthus annuus]